MTLYTSLHEPILNLDFSFKIDNLHFIKWNGDVLISIM